jgi:hypothetical protein
MHVTGMGRKGMPVGFDGEARRKEITGNNQT